MIAKCQCQSCGAEIEFDPADFLESGRDEKQILGQSVPCPNCGKETALAMPALVASNPKPKILEPPPTAQSAGAIKTHPATIIVGGILIIGLLAIFLWSAISNGNLTDSMKAVLIYAGISIIFCTIFCFVGFLVFALFAFKLWLRVIASALAIVGAWFLFAGVDGLISVANNPNGTIFQQQFSMQEIIGGGLLIGAGTLIFILSGLRQK